MPARRIGRWELLGELGRGGAGVVWRARDEQGREAALKVLLAGERATPNQRTRLAREAEALTRLRDPHLVRILDAGVADGLPFLAMELVGGEPLEARLTRQGPLSAREAGSLAWKLARGLAHAHAQGVLHRDVKPQNVILRPGGEPVLVDFGMTLAEDSQRLTATGQLMGTPGYWAPEQARGELDRIGPPVDVWALGATLYAMLTGVPPHGRTSSLAEALDALHQEPPPPSTRRPGIDPALEAICMRCLRREPAERWADGAALAEALAAWARGSTRGRRSARPAALAAAALVALGGGAAGLIVARRPGAATRPDDAVAAARSTTPPGPGTRQLDEAMFFVNRGLSRQEQGERGSALADFDRALALAPGLAAAWSARGSLRAALDDLEGARRDLDRALELAPEDPAALQNRAVLRQRAGDLPGALADYDRAVELDPTHVQALIDRGQLRHQLGDSPGALLDLQRALELEPGNGAAHGYRGNVRLALEDLEGALQDYDRAIELAPEVAFHRFNRAVARRAAGDPEGALQDYDRAIELAPGYVKALLNRANIHQALGQLERARADLDRALELAPDYGLAWGSRGLIRSQQGDVAGAAADWRRALELLDPASREAAQIERALAAASPVSAGTPAAEAAAGR